jgi:hypothetical protein
MKAKLHSTFCILHSAFYILLLALFTTTPRAPAQSVWNKALSLNGSTQYVALPAGIWFSNDFTIETWVYERSHASSSRVIDFGNGPGSDNVLMFLSYSTSGDVGLTVYRGGTHQDLFSPQPIPLNQWVHLAATLQGSNATIYVNGVAVVSINNVPPPNGVLRTNDYIGRSNWDNAYANAIFDDLRIWNVARTPGQIQDGMCHPLTGTEPNLVGYWKFDEVTGNTAHDATANHRDGTLVNGPVWTNSTIPPLVNVNLALSQASAGSVAWGDYDNDGRLDFLVTGFTNTPFSGMAFANQLWRNTGSGFTNVPTAALPTNSVPAIAWGDYNNDGRLDLLLVGAEETDLLRNTGGNFTNISAGLPISSMGSANGYSWGDYDNDGRLDMLLAGGMEQPDIQHSISMVLHNNGDGTFTDINAGVPGFLWDGTAAWGDYDNDGRQDILVIGDQAFYQIWRNTGTGFTNINAALIAVPTNTTYYGLGGAWGDCDNDGRLDLLLSWTYNTNGVWKYFTEVFRNNGDGTFSNMNAGLTGLARGMVAWGDYDNDGLLDILQTGYDSNSVAIVQLWRNTGTGFTNVPIWSSTPPGGVYSVAWGDYDNDGRLDILVQTDSGVQLWRNICPVTNTPPTAPTNVAANVVGRQVELIWTAATDAQTPPNGLSYNLRVGTTPGGIDVVSPEADLATGFRRVPARGSYQPGVHGLLRDLPLGVYYWSVQAVDTAFAGGPFSAESRFVVYPPSVATVGATPTGSTAATLHGTANPMEHDTTAWFEYGLTIAYGNVTGSTDLGAGTNAMAFDPPATGLLPWMTYHYRAVGSNCVGITVGPDATVTLPGPGTVTPYLSGLPSSLTLPQGGSNSIWFTASPAGLDVQVRGNNPVLLPPAGLNLLPSGSGYSLDVAPAPSQSGSALVNLPAKPST